MKYCGILTIVCVSVLFFSCNKSDSSISTNEYSEIINNTSSVPSIVPFQDSFEISQSIDGIKGGSINFDTTFVNGEGDTINFQINLKFLPNSFSGVRVVRMLPDFDSASVSFSLQ
jgi:hypothetical protein